jgi:hypothetical protein
MHFLLCKKFNVKSVKQIQFCVLKLQKVQSNPFSPIGLMFNFYFIYCTDSCGEFCRFRWCLCITHAYLLRRYCKVLFEVFLPSGRLILWGCKQTSCQISNAYLLWRNRLSGSCDLASPTTTSK